MNRRTSGAKRSSQLTFRRRLLLVRLLLRGPASSADLIDAIQRELGDEGYPPAATAALKHDFDALKAEYGCQIVYHRKTRVYALEGLGELALLDLSEPAMEAMAFLDASFPYGTGLPELTGVRTLLDQISRLLSAQRREQHQQQRVAARLRLPESVNNPLDAATLTTVKRAIDERRELEFQYLSSFDTGSARRHRVAPYGIFFRPEGHVYLDATLLEVNPAGGELIHAVIDYRLDRMLAGSAQVLPSMLSPTRLKPRTYRLRYELVPIVARRHDIAAYFPDTEITYQQDGSAIITATITNLWQARQILLRYGDACQVSEPPELVALFRKAVEGLLRKYPDP